MMVNCDGMLSQVLSILSQIKIIDIIELGLSEQILLNEQKHAHYRFKLTIIFYQQIL